MTMTASCAVRSTLATLLLTSASMAFGQLASVKPSALQLETKPAAGALAPAGTVRIDESKRIVASGNTRPEALDPANDRGPVPSSFPLDHMMLQLQRPAAKEAALVAYMETLDDKTAPNYHQWLTPMQLHDVYGPSDADVAVVTKWLTSKGFTVEHVYQTNMAIDFSGNAGQIKDAFHTELHYLSVNGVDHFANVSDPEIPAALAGTINGIVSLNDFKPHMMHTDVAKAHIGARPATTLPTDVKPNDTGTVDGSTYYLVGPGDLSKIYRLFKLFAKGITGKGQTIGVIEDSDWYKSSDIATFRSTFGLSTYAGTYTEVHPGTTKTTTCTDPGDVGGTDEEAELDVEYAGATAPDAAIELISCKDTTNFGGLVAMQNLASVGNSPAILSVSYGESESENGATANAAFSSVYQSLAAEGVSVFVSSGDEGAASSDPNATKATHGITVSGFASTPYNVAVGGTDFEDTYLGKDSTYWSSTNSSTYESALSYIPEIPWNDSCASVLISTASGFSTPYGTAGFCNSTTGEADYLTTGSGSGGPSGCATGAATTSGVVSGTCKGYAKPSWQSVYGNPSDSVRDLPDVSLFAANGVWGHYYPFCYTRTLYGGVSCAGAPTTWAGAGGTSFASPIVAAMQSLVNESTGSTWGNPNPIYYTLARNEYGTTGSTTCNSNGGTDGLTCTFHDITVGDMDVNCTGTHNCYLPSGTNGVLSTSDTAYDPAYGTNVGWDFATGIGSVDAQTLVNNFTTYANPNWVPIQ